MPKRRKGARGGPSKKAKTKSEAATEKKKQQSPRNINFSIIEPDPILEHLKEYSKREPSQPQESIDTILLDQIALEGLSGITLRRLFNIIEALFPNLICTTDLDCQKYVWSIILNCLLRNPPGAGIKAFHLGDTKDANCDNSRGVVIDKVIKLPTQTVKRIAKSDHLLCPVQDGLNMGSCPNYLARADITQHLIEESSKVDPLDCLYLLEDQYGLDNVFLVADQDVRAKAILPNWADPNVDIKLREYCTLELIGKSRSLGTVFPNDKSLGRYRIMLEAKGFITQFQSSMSSPIEHHLKRFSSRSNLIPNGKCKNVANKSATTPKTKQSKAKRKAKPEYSQKDDSSSGEDDDLIDSDSDRDNDYDGDAENLTPSVLCCDPSKLKPNRSILSTVYDVIADSGGINQIDLRKELNFPKFHLRNHLKNLVSLEMVCTRAPKEGDGSLKSFIAPKTCRRKKIKEEAMKPTGIMASWDEADLRAKKIIGHKRSSFSQAEDSILILCRITSVLIEPRLKLSWCVNKRLIRDLLHRELVEAHDKTSDACLRRIKYLKRLPNNIMSINELTAELQDDSDVRRLLRSRKIARKVNRRFLRLFKCVRTKIPNLLGIPGSSSTGRQVCKAKAYASRQKCQSRSGSVAASGAAGASETIGLLNSPEISDHEELRQKYDLVDCQSVASILRAPTYETPKNVVDVRLNQASLVTMAFAMTSCFGQLDGRQKRIGHWLLDKFYSNYHDKRISSMLSKLNKRSLLTRKCSVAKAIPYRPTSRLSLKLNQSVLFLLNRYQSHSLIQLANPISQSYSIDLCESNEMASIAMLTSLCSLRSFNLDMKLRVPANVVGIDQGNENFKNLCEKVNPGTREILARFMSRCGSSLDGHTGAPAVEGSETRAARPGSSAQVIEDPAATGEDGNSVEESTRGLNLNRITSAASPNKMDDSRRALFLLRHELKTHALDKCGSLADCLIVQPCNVKFFSSQQVESPSGPLECFLRRSRPIEADNSEEQSPGRQSAGGWLVKSYALSAPIVDATAPTTAMAGKRGLDKLAHSNEIDAADQAGASEGPRSTGATVRGAAAGLEGARGAEDEEDLITERSFEARKRPVEFYARAWKQIDGKVHLATLFKLVESILSWLIVLPGVELASLEREFCHLLPEENLHELLELMEQLELISSERLRPARRRPTLFGFRELEGAEASDKCLVYESTANAYVKYCQLLSYCRHHEQGF